MKFPLCLVILILLIVILLCQKKIEEFTIKTDNNNYLSKSISETYNYPACTGCITFGGKIKPSFNYNISDNRCVNNNTIGYINVSEMDKLINYTQLPATGFGSCYTNYNSLYSSIQGRYIVLFRNDNIKMRFKHISVHERDTTKSPLSIGATIFSTNLSKQTDGTYIYPETSLNSSDTNTITFESGTITNDKSYTVITLQNMSDIGYINIVHSNQTDANTLTGAVLVILKDTTLDLNPSTAQVVFYLTIDSNNINKKIYVYNYLSTLPSYLSPTMSIINKWILPCDNCSNMAGNLFQGHYYKSSTDERCYRPIYSDISKTILNSDIPTDILTAKFISCYPDFDTRYMPPNGRFIQINRSDGRNIGIKIAKIKIYSDYDKNYYDLTTTGMPYLTALVKTYLNDTSLFSNVLDDNETTSIITTNDSNSSIFIDLGTTTNKIISGIGLKIPQTEKNNVVGLRICIIKIDETDIFNVNKMTVTCEKIISQTDVQANSIEQGDNQSYTYLLPLQNNKNDSVLNYQYITINNKVTYNSTNKYLTTYKQGSTYYQIPYVIYNFPNNRSILAKTFTDSTNVLDKINLSDAVTLFNIGSNTSVSTVPGNPISHLVKPINARYIQFIPSGSYTLYNIIKTVELFDINTNLIKTFSNPPVIYNIPNVNYTSILSISGTGALNAGIVLLDLGTDTSITFIRITLNVTSNMTNCTMNLINNSSNRVYTYTFSNPQLVNYLITDINEINEVGSFFLNKYEYPSCLTSGICNIVAPNTYYVLNKKCFKSKDIITQCTDCMANLSTFPDNATYFQNIDANFVSCLTTGIDTRLPPDPLIVHFDASFPNSLFQDKLGTIPAVNINDPVNCWKTTSKTGSINAVTYFVNPARINSFISPNTKCVDFLDEKGTSLSARFDWNKDMSDVTDATLVILFIPPNKNNSGHPFNTLVSDNQSMFPSGLTNIKETFFTRQSENVSTTYTYNNLPNYLNKPIIYIVDANKDRNTCYCYLYSNFLIKIGTVPYSDYITTHPNITFTIGCNWYLSYNAFKLAELRIYSKTFTEDQLSSIASDLKIKWKITQESITWDSSVAGSFLDSNDNIISTFGKQINKWLPINKISDFVLTAVGTHIYTNRLLPPGLPKYMNDPMNIPFSSFNNEYSSKYELNTLTNLSAYNMTLFIIVRCQELIGSDLVDNSRPIVYTSDSPDSYSIYLSPIWSSADKTYYKPTIALGKSYNYKTDTLLGNTRPSSGRPFIMAISIYNIELTLYYKYITRGTNNKIIKINMINLNNLPDVNIVTFNGSPWYDGTGGDIWYLKYYSRELSDSEMLSEYTDLLIRFNAS